LIACAPTPTVTDTADGEWWEGGVPADGAPDRREAYLYDADGNELLYTLDADADGSVEVRHERTYDPAGRPLSVMVDSDADGTIDQSWLTTYVDC